MNKTKSILLASLMLISTMGFAQLPKVMPKMPSATEAAPMAKSTADSVVTDSTAMMLDKAVSANALGDKAATVTALKASTASMEKTASVSKGDFKDKLMGQVGNLQKLIPLAESGLLGGGVIQKAAGLAKMALGANQISSLLGGNSLMGKASALTGGLSLLKGGLPSLGGVSASTGGSLISSAMSAVGGLSSGGAAAEPAAKSALSGVLNFAKGVL
ncbi:MAG: hypothetical protein U5N85_09120 [Arcicella sp.]|nr:hypothetical protein [Arcicella sp.]